MAQNAYEHYDTAAWPGAGPIKNAFVGTAGDFDEGAQSYEDYEDGWVPWIKFTGDLNVEDFEEHGEFWETKWSVDKAELDDTGVTWSLVGVETFDDWEGGM